MDGDVPRPSRSDVVRLVRRDFSSADVPRVLEYLDVYDGRERERVQLGILKWADGGLSEIPGIVDTACLDYRDILAYAEYPAGMALSPGAPAEARRTASEADRRQYQAWLDRT